MCTRSEGIVRGIIKHGSSAFSRFMLNFLQSLVANVGSALELPRRREDIPTRACNSRNQPAKLKYRLSNHGP